MLHLEIVKTLLYIIVGVFASISVVMTANSRMKVSTILSYVFGLIIAFFFGLYGCQGFINILPEWKTLIMVVSVVWAFDSIVLIAFMMQAGRTVVLRKVSIFGVIACSLLACCPI